MRKTRCTDGQIALDLRQTEEGISVGEVCRKIGISEQAC